MAKFLHTADWHLGIKHARLGPKAEKAREIRINTLERLAIIAKERGVDFVIVAGDMFDSNEVDRKVLRIALNIMEKFAPIPVYILPGNHDPLTRDSLYLSSSWKLVSNVVVFESQKALRIPYLDVTIYPCPVTQKQTTSDLTEWIKAEDDSISIGVAHGNLQIRGFTDNPNFPIDPRRTEKAGLDYLALGEWHSLFKYKGEDGVVRTLYPGTPESTKFGENDSGKAMVVEIQAHGSQPIIEELEIGVLKWEEWSRSISTLEDVKSIEKELARIEEPQNRIVNLYLRGVVDQETAAYLDSLESRHSEQLLGFNIIKQELYLKPSLMELRAMMPEGAIFGKIISAIEALKKRHPALQAYSEIPTEGAEAILKEIRELEAAMSASPEVLDRALLILYQMAQK